jgi:hypothetical protein
VDPSSIARGSFEARLWLRCLNLGLELDPIVALAHCRWQRLFARDLSTDGFRNSQNAWSSDGAERDTLSLAGQSLFFSSSSGIPALSRQVHRAKNNE